MKEDIVLLRIDFPDESVPRIRDHMHAWGTQAEMRLRKTLLEDQFGRDRNHVLVDGYVCPWCGASPSSRRPT